MADGLEKGDPYFIILCDKPLFLNPDTFTDDWDNDWPKGELLIRGFYYERISSHQRDQIVMYRLIKEKHAFPAS
jgi:hypothetical protein